MLRRYASIRWSVALQLSQYLVSSWSSEQKLSKHPWIHLNLWENKIILKTRQRNEFRYNLLPSSHSFQLLLWRQFYLWRLIRHQDLEIIIFVHGKENRESACIDLLQRKKSCASSQHTRGRCLLLTEWTLLFSHCMRYDYFFAHSLKPFVCL